MQNWAGQQIKVGSVVWRGVRDGNSSTFKIGVVEKLNSATGRPTVKWMYTQGQYWLVEKHIPKRAWEFLPKVVRLSYKGAPDVNSLAVIDIDLAFLEEVCDYWATLNEDAKHIQRGLHTTA